MASPSPGSSFSPQSTAYLVGGGIASMTAAAFMIRDDFGAPGSTALDDFTDVLQSDVTDIQQGTSFEGVHLGALAGTVDLTQRGSTRIEVDADVLRLNPELSSVVRRKITAPITTSTPSTGVRRLCRSRRDHESMASATSWGSSS